MRHEVNIGSIVKTSLGKLNLLVLVEEIKIANNITLLPNTTLATATSFLPDPSPNAVGEFLLCGRTFICSNLRNIKLSRFEKPVLCLNYNDVEEVLTADNKHRLE